MITAKLISKRFRKLKKINRTNYLLIDIFIKYLNRICLRPNTNESHLDSKIATDEIWKFINQNNFSEYIIETLRISFIFYQNLDIGCNKPLQNDQIAI